jgi:hypothetical protein
VPNPTEAQTLIKKLPYRCVVDPTLNIFSVQGILLSLDVKSVNILKGMLQ